MSEVYWREIEGYEGIYECSTDGQVRSVDRIAIRGNHKVNRKGRTLKPGDNGVGYLVVGLCKNNRCETKKVHQLITETFLIRGEGETQVNHKNGIKTDNNVSNLHWCSGSENMIHANENGMGRGKRLNVQEVADITRRFTNGDINKIGLAIEYGVSRRTIGKIIDHPERFEPTKPPASRHVVLIADTPDIR